MKKSAKTKKPLPARLAALALLVLLLAGVLLLRTRAAARETAAPEQPTPTPQSTVDTSTAPEPTPKPAQPTPEPAPEPTEPTPEAAEPAAERSWEAPTPVEPERIRTLRYTQKTYELVSDMVFTYRYLQEDGAATVERDVKQLKQLDPPLGELWQGIMDCWRYTNTSIPVNSETMPEDLPQDESLAIVVLGFELLSDGGMTPELIGRCELALQCAQAYPNARLILCGGYTAKVNKAVSEAGAMARWLEEKGIPRERMVLEDSSMTTADNAVNTCEILARRYPTVNRILLVTSDYHVPLATLLFTEASLIWEQEYGYRPYTVADNAALKTPGRPDYAGTTKSAEYLWSMADPYYT